MNICTSFQAHQKLFCDFGTMGSEDSDANHYRSTEEAILTFICHNLLALYTLVLFIQAIYHLFIKLTFNSSYYVRSSVTISLLFDFAFCAWAVFVSYFRVFQPSFNPCIIGVQLVPFLAIGRISLYYFFLARYLYLFLFLAFHP